MEISLLIRVGAARLRRGEAIIALRDHQKKRENVAHLHQESR
jgi:hypothetical protein